MSFSVKQSEAYRQALTELETATSLLEMTEAEKEALVVNTLLDDEMKALELSHINAVTELLRQRKKASEAEWARQSHYEPLRIESTDADK